MQYYGKSHIGLHRRNNQDSICLAENEEHSVLGVVCDGIGGGRAGDVASNMATSHIKDRFLRTSFKGKNDQEVKSWLTTIIHEANDLIFASAAKNENYRGMGTTMVGVLYCNKVTYVFNVGDSRTYGLYQNDFLCLTEDHSFVADLVKSGKITMEEAQHHPRRNVLTNALGIWNAIRIDINKVKDGYRLLLICSDGLHGYVKEDAILHVLLEQKDMHTKVDELITKALEVGGYDNISVILMGEEDCTHV